MIAFACREASHSRTYEPVIFEHLRLSGCEHLNVSYYGKTRAASQFGSALASLLAAGPVVRTGSFRIIFLASTTPHVLNRPAHPAAVSHGGLGRAERRDLTSSRSGRSRNVLRLDQSANTRSRSQNSMS